MIGKGVPDTFRSVLRIEGTSAHGWGSSRKSEGFNARHRGTESGPESDRTDKALSDIPNDHANTRTAAPMVGPRDRESFFEAQRRNRRATWRLSAVAVIATVVMGIPLALTITPLLYAAAVNHR